MQKVWFEVQDELIAALKALRSGTGMTVQKLVSLPVLLRTLGVETTQEAFDAIKALVEGHDDKYWLALRNIYGLGEFQGDKADGGRRTDYAVHIGRHEDTIERWENRAIAELAALITSGTRADEAPVPPPGGFFVIDPDKTWSIQMNDVGVMWDWVPTGQTLLLRHNVLRRSRLVLSRFEDGQSLTLTLHWVGEAEHVAWARWPSEGREVGIYLYWHTSIYPPFLTVDMNGTRRAHTFDDEHRGASLDMPEDCSQMTLEWWWISQGAAPPPKRVQY